MCICFSHRFRWLQNMAKYCFLLAILFVGGLALPAQDDGPGFDEDMSIFFDHTETDGGRIVGGTQAANGAFPWMVALTNNNGRTFICGGSIIDVRRVLTAAHCIAAVVTAGQLSRNFRVTVGTNRWASGGQTYQLSGFRNHPQYNPNTIKNDIGVLMVSTNIIWNNQVRAIPLSWAFIGANARCRVSGWGRTSAGGPLSATLLELRTSSIDGQRCVTEVARMGQQLNMRVPPVQPNIEICTFLAVNRGTCNGDSGSALVLDSNNHQIGIVAWGLPCARGAPDMFTRVSAFRPFITSV